ncbi:MAG: viroplasmin family protein [Fusobacteriota bacterium]
MAKNKFYAYYLVKPKISGITKSWPQCQEIIKNQKARYKGFKTKDEAQDWLDNGAIYEDKKNKYYAYYRSDDNKSGITRSWKKCQSIIKKGKVRYKSFKTQKEAQDWLDNGAIYETKEMLQEKLKDGIYFDAGTGRGIGVEVRVTDKKGNSLVDKIVPKDKVNEYGNYLTKKGSTNNYGELLGMYIALKLALKTDQKRIFGDSKLVIDYWSNGYIKKEKVADDTVKLSERVKKLRKKFEKRDGIIEHVSGDINPADLGFH